MAKKHELKLALSKAAEELATMAGKSDAEGFNQEIHDALEEKILELKKQLKRVEDAEKVAASLAQPSPDGNRLTPRAPAKANRLYSSIKSFKDREIDGQMIRAADQAYLAGMWLRATAMNDERAMDWCKMNGIAMTKAQGEGIDSSGGFLVPEELMAAIIVLREEFGVFRRECQVVPMGTDTLNWPRRVGGLTAFFTGENQSATESQATWDSINLTAKKLAVLTRFSNELAEDAVISIGDWLVGEIAYAFASKEDDCGFNGDGTSTYGGIRGLRTLAIDGNHNSSKYTAASGHNSYATLDMTDMTGLMATLPEYAKPDAKWYISQVGFYSTMGRLMGAAGGNRIDTLTMEIEKRFLGFPVVISQKLPLTAPLTSQTGAAMFFFGNLAKAAAMGERRQITIRRSEHRYFENDQIGLLGTERFDINIHDFGDQSIRDQTGNLVAVPGPLVAMVAP